MSPLNPAAPVPRSFGLLDLLAQSLLPLLGGFDAQRLARDLWSTWPASQRATDLEALRTLIEPGPVVETLVREVLPGRPGPEHAALGAYLDAVPFLLRRHGWADPASAGDLLHWLPACCPRHRRHTSPPGVGDLILAEPLTLRPEVEVWLARQAHLPIPCLLALYADRATADQVLQWHILHRQRPSPSSETMPASAVLPVVHTYLRAESPALQFACPAQPGGFAALLARPSLDHLPHYRRILEVAASLHRLAPPLCLGPMQPGEILLEKGPFLAVTQVSPDTDRRGDVLNLARLGRQLLGGENEALTAVFTRFSNDDPLVALGDAGTLLEQIDAVFPHSSSAPPPPADLPPAPAPEPAKPRRRSAEVWKVLDSLQKTVSEMPKLITNSLGMRFVLIPAGTFSMGSSATEASRRDNEGPQHEVVLTRPYYLGIHPVTQDHYRRVIGTNPARFQGAAGGGPEHPVENVSWEDALAYALRLSELAAEKEAGRTYRLPTEAEWEYACRAASTTPFHSGASLSSTQACFDGQYPYGGAPRGQSPPRTTPVGMFPANAWGLHDMHGNVWEWCNDWFDAGYYARSPRQDPHGPETGEFRVLRGGSWRNQAATCRSAYRNALPPNQKQPFIGFRLVLEVKAGSGPL